MKLRSPNFGKLRDALKTKRINKRVLLIVALILLVLSAGAIYAAFFKDDTPTVQASEFSTLNASYFSSTVSATGTISPDRDMDVYTTQTAPVKQILVEEKEHVQQGQVMAYLDDGNLRDQIAMKEAATGVSARSAAAQVDSARNRYNAGIRALRQGTNSALVSAQNAVESAQRSWEAAEKVYEDYKRSMEEGYNPQLGGNDGTSDTINQAVRNAQLTFDQAQSSLTETENDLRQAQSDISLYDSQRTTLRNQVNDLQAEISAAQRDLATEQGRESTYEGLEQQLTAAEAARDVARDNLPADPTGSMNPMDPMYESAVTAYQTARASLDTAQAQVDALRIQLGDTRTGNADSIASRIDDLNRQLSEVNVQLTEAESEYSKAVANKDSYEAALPGKRDALKNAQTALENALQDQKRNTKNNQDTDKNLADTLATHRQSADTALNAYQQALRSQASARASANDEVESLADNLNSTIASGDNSAAQVELAALYNDLQDMTITAPMSGVVTKVNATVGSAGAGSLFKIEALDSLLIETELKEFDVNTVRPGMKVEVKTDATGNSVYYGKVVSISPISTQHTASLESGGLGGSGSSGGTSSGGGSSQPTFKTVIHLEGAPATLKAGMNARLSIIVSEDQNVYAVPYSAVFENDAGDTVVRAAVAQHDKKGTYIIREIPVTTSLENDLSIVVEGEGLEGGQRILINPENHQPGDVISISDNTDETPGVS